jgi:shikimate dehydrogenase
MRHLVGLVGAPVGQSLSPAMMRAAFAAAGLDAEYAVMETDAPGLAAAVQRFAREGSPGFNVTIPHKAAIIPFCRRLAPSAAAASAVNTMVREREGWVGHNTDGEGLAAFLDRRGVSRDGRQIVLLGAGGAARGIAARLVADSPRGVLIANRDLSRADELADLVRGLTPGMPVGTAALTEGAIRPLLTPPLLVIQATSLGAGGVGCPRFPFSALSPADAVIDAVYRPEETPFLAAARCAGAEILPGWGMLLYQGAAAFTLWFGIPAPIAAMERALLDELAEGG